MVVVLPILTLAVLGIMEVGHAMTVNHAMTALSREGANLAARGTALGQVAQLMLDNGGDIGMAGNGGSVVSRVQIQGGVPVIMEQEQRGTVGTSKIGAQGDSVAGAMGGAAFSDGRVLYTVEVFYDYNPITPLVGIGANIVPGGLYARTVF